MWRTRQISAVMPEIEPVLASLLGELRESGLVQENDTAPDAVKSLSEDLAKQVNRQTGEHTEWLAHDRSANSRSSRACDQTPEPTWSPTELGEKILGFYAEAGAEDSQDQG